MGQKYSEEQWEELLREYREGSMTAKAWCKSKGVSENALYYWQKKLRDKISVKEKETQWALLSLSEDSKRPAPITLRYGEFRIEIEDKFNKTVLAEVLRVVMQLC